MPRSGAKQTRCPPDLPSSFLTPEMYFHRTAVPSKSAQNARKNAKVQFWTNGCALCHLLPFAVEKPCTTTLVVQIATPLSPPEVFITRSLAVSERGSERKKTRLTATTRRRFLSITTRFGSDDQPRNPSSEATRLNGLEMIENEHEIGVHDATRHRPDRAIEFFVFFFVIYSKFMAINFRSNSLKLRHRGVCFLSEVKRGRLKTRVALFASLRRAFLKGGVVVVHPIEHRPSCQVRRSPERGGGSAATGAEWRRALCAEAALPARFCS